MGPIVHANDQKTNVVNNSDAALSAREARRLAARTPLALDPARPFAIKRTVHEVEVEADAAALARAFAAMAAEPGARFGPIVLKRPAERVGRPFEVNDRFHGCFALPVRGRAARWIEDRFLSDYAEVAALELAAPPYRVEYRYLSGTPIAGRSAFAIEPRGPGRARLTVVFEFQEVAALALGALHRFALKKHDEAILAQAEEAARRAGGRVVRSTIEP